MKLYHALGMQLGKVFLSKQCPAHTGGIALEPSRVLAGDSTLDWEFKAFRDFHRGTSRCYPTTHEVLIGVTSTTPSDNRGGNWVAWGLSLWLSLGTLAWLALPVDTSHLAGPSLWVIKEPH